METIKIAQMSEYHGTTKRGKPYSKWNIVDGGGRKLSCFKGQWNIGWKVGDILNVEIEQSGQYTNIKAPPRPQDAAAQANNEKLTVLNNKLDKILSILTAKADCTAGHDLETEMDARDDFPL